jgi:lysophospholipase L1-like esterase
VKTGRVLCVVLLAILPSAGCRGERPGAGRARPRPEYIALGDSLATDQGYVDVLARRLGLRATNLSCGGATTRTLIHGRAGCQPSGEPGQLPRAEAFLRAHRDTALVTVDVGDNDVEPCVSERGVDRACVAAGMARIGRNLPVIARRLRAAAGPRAAVVGVIDYDQFLAYWLDGAAGRRAARRSLGVLEPLNARMAAIYRAAGVLVADAGARFAIADLTTPRRLPGHGEVPLAVFRTCLWTWACNGDDLAADDHPNAAGYRQIARAGLCVLPRSLRQEPAEAATVPCGRGRRR